MANELTIGTKSTGKLTTDATSYVRGRVNSHGDKLLAGATWLGSEKITMIIVFIHQFMAIRLEYKMLTNKLKIKNKIERYK